MNQENMNSTGYNHLRLCVIIYLWFQYQTRDENKSWITFGLQLAETHNNNWQMQKEIYV